MKMDLVSFLNSIIGPILGLFLGRLLSRDQAYRFGDWLAGKIASRSKSWAVQAARANQAVVRGLSYDAPELDLAVRNLFRNTARDYADWYRAIASGPEFLISSVSIDERLEQIMRASISDKRGLIVVGAHMHHFNIMLLAIGVHGYPIQALSFANVQGGKHIDNAIRRKFGFNVTPISFQSLRQAVLRLREGGIVMTGIDRPDVGGEQLTFFGRPAVLPVGHARLALRTNSAILVGMVQTMGNGIYKAVSAPLIEPQSTGDKQKDVITLAQRVLSVIEDQIHSNPEEWLMFYPVWPDVLPA